MGKRVVVIVVVVLALAGLAYAGLRQLGAGASRAIQDSLQTAKVQRGTLVATVSTAGTVDAPNTVSLAFQVSGPVAEIAIKQGEQVKAGQQIACLDATDAELQVEQAEASLALAQARLDQARKGSAAEEIAAARASLVSAQESLKRLQGGPTMSDIEIARLRWEQAKDQLWGAQAQRDATLGNPVAASASKDQAQAAVASAEMAAEIARLQYEQVRQGSNASELRAAEAQVAQAQSTLARLAAGPAAEDVRAAEAQVQQAEVTLRQARHRLAQTCLVAPFSGLVARLSLDLGQIVGPTNPVGVLADLEAGDAGAKLEIAADMSEIDVAKIRVGQEATITLDALPDRTFKGRVTAVAAVGTSAQGVVNYPVTIAIDDADAAIRPAMTANAEIIVERRDNVLLAPNRTIRVENGRRFVQVWREGRPSRVQVQLGLSGDGNTEILGDTLKEGDVLLVNPSPNLLRQMSAGPGGPVGFEAD